MVIVTNQLYNWSIYVLKLVNGDIERNIGSLKLPLLIKDINQSSFFQKIKIVHKWEVLFDTLKKI